MINGIYGINSYTSPRVNEEQTIARTVAEEKVQVRIAENSDDRRVLLALAANRELSEAAIQALYSRDLDYLTNRLNALGYKKTNWFGF